MQRVTTLLLLTVLAAGCSKDGRFIKESFFSDVCGHEVGGYTYTAIVYGDSILTVIPISEIEPNTEWRFYLFPVTDSEDPPHDYRTVHVEIRGEVPAEPPLNILDNLWIGADGTYADAGTGQLRYIADCVEPDLISDTIFKYEVIVEEVGRLDPRADVR